MTFSLTKTASSDANIVTNKPKKSVWVVIPAAGIGARMKSDVPKQYLPLRSETVIEVTLKKLLSLSYVEGVVVALHKDDDIWPTLAIAQSPKVHRVDGGKERSDSVLKALQYCQDTLVTETEHKNTWVLVHDAARPCVSTARIDDLVESVLGVYGDDPYRGGGILAAPIADTVKRVDISTKHPVGIGGSIGQVRGTEDRSELWLAHTPQFFSLPYLHQSLTACVRNKVAVTDEASAVEACRGEVKVVADLRDNIKITLPEDLVWAENILEKQA